MKKKQTELFENDKKTRKKAIKKNMKLKILKIPTPVRKSEETLVSYFLGNSKQKSCFMTGHFRIF